MIDNTQHLLAQHERVEAVVKEYEAFVFKAMLRLLNPIRYILAVSAFSRAMAPRTRDPSLTAEERRRARLTALFMHLYKEDERQSAFFKIALSKYRLNDLSEYVEDRYPGLDFSKLADVGTVLSPPISRWGLVRISGAILAVGTIFLQTVPQPVVKQFTENYDRYRIWVFWSMVIALGYATLVIGPTVLGDWRHRQRQQILTSLLTYLKLKHDGAQP